MRASLKLALALMFAFAALSPGAQLVAFEHANVIPMDRERVLENQTVVVRDGKIADMGPAARMKVPQGATRIEAKGKYLIPGLTEMHGHLPGGPQSIGEAEQVLFLYVSNGVTTVRGMLGTPENLRQRDEINAGRLLGPRLFVAGPPFNGQTASTVEEARREVREQKQAGYDHLKILGGMRPEVYDAIAETAKQGNISFVGHVPPEVGAFHSMEAGQKSIDHMDGYLETLGPGIDSIDESKIPALVSAAVKSGVWTVPTMAVWDNFYSNETGDQFRERLPELKYLPKSHVNGWVQSKNRTVQMAAQRKGGGGFGRGGQPGERVMVVRRRMLRALHEGGAKIAFGTDAPQLFNVPGFSIHHEMPIMVQCGFTPFEVLQSATVNPAEYWGIQDEAGTIAKGKRADLVLLEANPLDSVANVAKRAGVMVHGRWLPESEIQARLAKYAEQSANE
jgi:Amidohydrolase family